MLSGIMITRRNWLLRCSILINVAVLLYVCSQVMIDTNDTVMFSVGQQQQQSEDLRKLAMMRVASNVDSRRELQNYGVGEKDQPIESIPNAVELEQQQELSDDKLAVGAGQDNSNANDKIGGDVKSPSVEDTRFDMPVGTDQADVVDNSNTVAGNRVAAASADSSAVVVGDEPNLVSGASSGSAVAVAGTSNLNNMSDPFTIQGDDVETKLKQLIECHNRDYQPQTVQRGDFWVLKNYVRAEHGELRCFETVTYTTHADYSFLDNLIPLLRRWNAPVSIALHAPGTDFLPTIKSIQYLRECALDSNLVRQFATFHVFFSSKHIPKSVPKPDKVFATPYNCTIPPPYTNVTAAQLYKTQKKLLYPVNVGRNVARDHAMTHFILASDIELYPNPGLPRKFLEMVARNDAPLQHKNPKVFPLSIFEVDAASQVPRDKTELQELLRTGKAIPFHKRVCASCHGVPKSKEWMAANETAELGIFHIGKRVGYFVHWEPIYIGTHADPHYDERLSWEGKSDKMTQGYALCALDYEFQILDNAFLVHKPGIKVLKKDTKRAMLAGKTNDLIKKIIYPELKVMYGIRKGCAV